MKLHVLKALGASDKSSGIFYRVGDVVEPTKAEAATLLIKYADHFDVADEAAEALKSELAAGARYATVEYLADLVIA